VLSVSPIPASVFLSSPDDAAFDEPQAHNVTAMIPAIASLMILFIDASQHFS
jgi:hypothetical protein